ncbi:MAG: bifunctional 5,10-methylenetetrahydrofolate dehydrogenase/5,10-methenyltetrahydrofolate cyclohydrolase [Candidatus Omnitrophica bacterium]|nr:bifunctional 5,10-methylenetetrahydrofolate dehydrogenase/5,10-methenyltetrahydrofolate cyclohydrolase [Candidatus Omnitrophota bacterium]
MAHLLEGKPIAERLKEELKKEILNFDIKPVLASIQVLENPACEVYIKSQKKTAESLGIDYRFYKLDSNISESKLIEFIQNLNLDNSIHGIILQMPLPSHIDYKNISEYIDPKKDVEGLNPKNLGKLIFGKAKILPCTPSAVMELLKETKVDLYGKEVVVVGHSEIVGKPLALLLLEKFATTTVCHIATSQRSKLEEHVKQAEILVVAVGKANLIKGNWIKEGAIVIDVGINKVGDKIVGDVELEEASKRASWITPVPGGVGPLTTVMLMRNLLEATKLQI